MNGQVAIMEYVVLLIMISFIVIFVVFMVFGFEILGSGSSQAEHLERSSMFLLNRMLASEAINTPTFQKGSVFDGGKLSALSSLGCKEFRKLYGSDTWANISIIFEKKDCVGSNFECTSYNKAIDRMNGVECTTSTYPYCGSWEFCSENKDPRMVYRNVPVNVYLNLNDTTMLGVLYVGVKVTDT